MSTNGNLEDLKLLRIQVMEDVGADDQIWIYQEGYIKCRIAEDRCQTIVGSLVTSGSMLGLALEQNTDGQFWSMKPDGRIYNKLKPNLVLDIKGGTQYDQKSPYPQHCQQREVNTSVESHGPVDLNREHRKNISGSLPELPYLNRKKEKKGLLLEARRSRPASLTTLKSLLNHIAVTRATSHLIKRL